MTPADFFNVERNRQAAPSGGGGQSYFSISFTGLEHEELGRFLGVDPADRVRTERPTVVLDDVAVIDDPAVTGPLTFAARYRPLAVLWRAAHDDGREPATGTQPE